MENLTKEQFWHILSSPIIARQCGTCKYEDREGDECFHPTAARKPFEFISGQMVDDIKCSGYYHDGLSFDREVYEADWGNHIVDLWEWNGETHE